MTTVAVAALPGLARRPSQRSPETVRAQVKPEIAPIRLPVRGSGAVATAGCDDPTHNHMPPATAARNSRSDLPRGSLSNSGPISSRYRGAVDCKKIAFAEMVSLVASVNATRVAA
jgi:hypothetical protein